MIEAIGIAVLGLGVLGIIAPWVYLLIVEGEK